MANKEFGAKLKSLRNKNNLTQKDVYEQLGVSQSTFSSWEIGKSEPDAKTFLKLCKIYKVYDILLEFTGESLQPEKNKLLNMFDALDSEDQAEIRGEMRYMLKSDKYKYRQPQTFIAAKGQSLRDHDANHLFNFPRRLRLADISSEERSRERLIPEDDEE